MMQTSKTSQWAGYVTSAFAITLFVTVIAFYGSEQTLLNWWPVVTALCMMLAAFSGVVCLVSAIFSSFRGRRRSRSAGLELSRRAFKLDS
ncbi:MAG: hypothetical protein ABSC55_13380 [Syntrophorhabdales bacterium]|jgi:RsiW-degrading membrane proteinase PrsW (M82 family)